MAWFGAGLFLFGAMATYREDVQPIVDSRWHNVCGVIGFQVARLLLTHLGYAAFLIPIALLGEGSRLLRAASGRPLWVRAVGILLFAATLAAVLADLFGGRSAWIPDPGGDFGVALAMLLKNDHGLGLLGGRIALAVMFLLTFVLYADLLYAGSAESALRWIDDHGGLLAVLPWTGRRGGASKRGAKRRRGGDDDDEPTSVSKAELDRALDDALGVATKESDAKDSDEDEDPEGEESGTPPPKRARKKRAAKVEAADSEDEAAAEEPDDAEELKAAEESEEPEAADEEVGEEVGEEEPDEEPVKKPKLLKRLFGKSEKEPAPKRIPLIVMPRKTQASIVAKEIQSPEPPQIRSAKPYRFPPFNLLDAPKRESSGDFLRFTDEVARKLTAVLKSFKVEANVVGVQRGPIITMLEVELAPGTKVTKTARARGRPRDGARGASVRIVAPIPGKNDRRHRDPEPDRATTSGCAELLQSPEFKQSKSAIPIFLGKDAAGKPHRRGPRAHAAPADRRLDRLRQVGLPQHDHLSILYDAHARQVRLILIDPKMVELSTFAERPAPHRVRSSPT